MGSGSTGKAAMAEGVNFVGIEMQKDFVEISRARIEHARKNLPQNNAEQKVTAAKQNNKKTVGDQFFDWGDDT